MDRLALSDAAWEWMAPLIIGRPDQKVRPDATTGCSWKACCGSCAQALPGAIFPRRSSLHFGDIHGRSALPSTSDVIRNAANGREGPEGDSCTAADNWAVAHHSRGLGPPLPRFRVAAIPGVNASATRPLEPHSAPRAFRKGALDIIISPVNGRPSSKIRKIAQAAEKANRERQVNSVMFRGENRL